MSKIVIRQHLCRSSIDIQPCWPPLWESTKAQYSWW